MAIRIRIFPIIVLGLLVVFLLWIPYYVYMLGPVNSLVQTLGALEPAEFQIAKGDGVRLISERLERAELVKSAKFFRLYVFFEREGASVEARVLYGKRRLLNG